MIKLNLKKGASVHVSERGHHGFFYPSPETETLLHDIEADRLSWTGAQNHVAVTIPESAVYGSGRKEKLIAVWVKKNNGE